MNQLEGLRFRRQAPIDHYIVDFVCYEKRLVIEADGGQHNGSEADRVRDEYLKEHGFIVLRFWNHDILTNIQGVLEMIRAACQNQCPPPRSSPARGEEKMR